jgi:hypothetical protein
MRSRSAIHLTVTIIFSRRRGAISIFSRPPLPSLARAGFLIFRCFSDRAVPRLNGAGTPQRGVPLEFGHLELGKLIQQPGVLVNFQAAAARSMASGVTWSAPVGNLRGCWANWRRSSLTKSRQEGRLAWARHLGKGS